MSVVSAVARHQVSIDPAQRLSLGADTPAGTILRIPAVQINVHPRGRLAHEALQEQCAEYRSRKCGGSHIVQIRNLPDELILEPHPKRLGPQPDLLDGRETCD